MKGEDAVTKALLAAADRFYGVPGFPVSGVLQKTGAESVINEKVAVEYALGDSLSGRRAAVILKNVGLNACADPFVEATTQGLLAGVVIVAGDDPAAEGSQNAQDSRYYGELAEVPVIEPGPDNIHEAVEEAFRASESFSRIVILRVTPDLLEAEVTPGNTERKGKTGEVAPLQLTMKGRVERARNMLGPMCEWSEKSPLNRMNGTTALVGAAGAGYKPAHPGAISRIITIYPPTAGIGSLKEIKELGRPFVMEHRGMVPPVCTEPERREDRGFYRSFCKDCPFILAIKILDERGILVTCDAGCCVLCMNPPYKTSLVSYGMGSSIAVAAKSTGVALTGDYALLHSGLPALIDVFEKKTPLLCIIMKNNCMGMTGGQQAYDILPYIAWADPVTCRADDEARLRETLVRRESPIVVIIEGNCPEGRHHETVEC
ncbi:MAG: thiamine pyrophosphate-dependent enzyme [Methanomicrobiales archaeon]